MNILSALKELAEDCPIVFPAHPRTQQRIVEFGMELSLAINKTRTKEDAGGIGGKSSGIILTEPLGYLDFLCMMTHAALVITDSGGIQEETTGLAVPCVTVRENTERPVTVESGTNVIAGTTKGKIEAAIRQQMGRKDVHLMPKYWDGHAATRIVGILTRALRERMCPPTAVERVGA